MYLMVTHIPVYTEGSRYYTDISWQRDLLLARDWLAPSFGPFSVICPSLPLACKRCNEVQVASIGQDDGIRVVSSFDHRCRAAAFWMKQRRRWLADLRRELPAAKLVHSSAPFNVFRPVGFLGHRAAAAAGVPTVLVGPDMDPHAVARGVKGNISRMLFDAWMRRAMRRADLALLKDGPIYNRYARYGRNVNAFHHSMHRREDVITEDRLERRLQSLSQDRPLRAVYAGRFVARKGISDAISAVAQAKRLGAHVEYYLYGSGPEEEALRRQVKELDVEDIVKFQGFVEYGPDFLARLADFDLLLFMPTEEDTPRMLYDAMAAGLPLVGSRIPFLSHHIDTDRAGSLVNIGDARAAAESLMQLHSNRTQLVELARLARASGDRNTIEQWYGRRAAWTREAADRHIARRSHAS